MARIAGVDIPREKRLEISLTYIFGIGKTTAQKMCDSLGLDLTALNVVAGDRLDVVAPSQMPEAAVARYHQVSVEADLPGPIAIRTNQPVILASYDAIAERFPDIVDPAIGLPRIEKFFPVWVCCGLVLGARAAVVALLIVLVASSRRRDDESK